VGGVCENWMVPEHCREIGGLSEQSAVCVSLCNGSRGEIGE
jgi:hypothetical protein